MIYVTHNKKLLLIVSMPADKIKFSIMQAATAFPKGEKKQRGRRISS